VTELTIEDGQPLHVKAVFEFIPDFSIEGYETVTVAKPPVELTDEEVKRELEQLREAHATIEPVEEERALENGDWAEISYKGLVDGEADAAPVAGESTLVEVGGKDTVEAFTTVLRGARAGQELKAEVIYPWLTKSRSRPSRSAPCPSWTTTLPGSWAAMRTWRSWKARSASI
jgi:trigger factor